MLKWLCLKWFFYKLGGSWRGAVEEGGVRSFLLRLFFLFRVGGKGIGKKFSELNLCDSCFGRDSCFGLSVFIMVIKEFEFCRKRNVFLVIGIYRWIFFWRLRFLIL